MSYLGWFLVIVVVAAIVWKQKSKVRGLGGSFEQEKPKQKQK
jgi:hypothetical protein